MRLSLGTRGQRNLPMPLWLQGAYELAQIALICAALVTIPVFGIWFAGGFEDRSVASLWHLSGQLWLFMHGTPLEIAWPGADAGAMLSLIPLGAVLIPFLLAWRAGRRLARASYSDQLWQALLGGIWIYAAASLAIAHFSADGTARASLLAGTLIPLISIVLGLVIGARREAGSWSQLVGYDMSPWAEKVSQATRWAGSYFLAVARAGTLAFVAVFGLSAALFAINLAIHWADVIRITESLHPGVVGGIGLLLIHLAYAPTFVIWTAAYSSGAGFSVGTDTIVSPLETTLGPLPALPMLGALPAPGMPYGMIALLIPVVAGVLAGWWLLREGENHFDDWLAIRIPQRWLSVSLSTLALGLLVGVVTAAMTMALSWLSVGGVGAGRLADLGPDPLFVGLLVGAEVAIGVFIGYAVGPWLERKPPVEEVPNYEPVSATMPVEDLTPVR